MATPVFGTANLFGLVGADDSDRLLNAALDGGFRAVDTAPSYGFGRSEAAVGRAIAALRDDVCVTTKVGLRAGREPSPAVRAAKALARRLPAAVRRRVRGEDSGVRGDFEVADVRAGVEQSLRRLGHIDRLLLHEVHADDLTDDLLTELTRLHQGGDVGAVGIATTNDRIADCLALAPDVLTTVNLAVGPCSDPVPLPDTVTCRTGHGVFGANGSELRRMHGLLRSTPALGAAWQAGTQGTPWSGANGLADALVSHAVTAGGSEPGSARAVDAVILATSRADRLAHLRETVGAAHELPDALADVIDALCAAGQAP